MMNESVGVIHASVPGDTQEETKMDRPFCLHPLLEENQSFFVRFALQKEKLVEKLVEHKGETRQKMWKSCQTLRRMEG